ncbi:MAG: DEAD/DEAH box helicase [Chloroflexi bacterium]|nr:DEAD/DEAH box helicase [Chloroflexota bacterium]
MPTLNQILVTIPEQGQLVDVRQRRYLVVEVAQGLLPPDLLKAGGLTTRQPGQHLVTLASMEDDALGEELQVIWEIEPGAAIIEKNSLPRPADGFDPPHRLDAFLNAVRWGAASSADVNALQSPFRSGIDIEDYQLDPVARAIQMPRVNLLIADDVGLGKTIEAGLVAQELIIRHRARRILVVCPAALQIQWQQQMRDKFGLEFRVIDSTLMKDLRRQRGLHVNPWTHFPRLITSLDYLKRERPMRLFKEALPADGESTYPRRFDLLIVDEAHNVAPSGRGQYATDSLRTLTLRALAPHFEHKLFLSATPHNGYQESFSALLELLDNQRFARGVVPDKVQLGAIMIRRLKSELPPGWNGLPRFPKRVLEPIEVDYTEAEKEVHRQLQEYTRLRVESAQDETERYASEFVLKLLKKRLFSSPKAFALTLARHEESLSSAKRRSAAGATFRPNMGILRRQIEQVEEETDDDTTQEEATAAALEAAAPLFREPTAQERTLLRRMREWAERASARADNKADRLIKWLKETIKPGGKWSNERVIIFTEYRDTQKWLQELLATHELAEDGRLQVLYGGMQSEDREKIKAAFQADPRASKVRILLATDAASEGIDLQNHCSRLIHYEIPWNPNRMEQRNGRIDRHGQHASEVKVYHFVGSTYRNRRNLLLDDDLPVGELEADLEFLMRAVRKVETIREDLGKVGPVIAEQVEAAMLGRRRKLDTREAEAKATPARQLLKFERNLDKQIKALYKQLQESKLELNLTPQNIQAVVEIALQLAQQLPLQKQILRDPLGKQKDIEVFYLPALKGSWATCSQGLAHPHTGEIRPIVFDQELSSGRDDVVLAHLNHRLVTMSLRLLRAEVWSPASQQQLHRVAIKVVPNLELQKPAVIAHARLLLIGVDSQRLHEEIIVAGGFMGEGPLEQMEIEKIEKLLSVARPDPISPAKEKELNLAGLWTKFNHEQALYQALEKRKNKRTKDLKKKLQERADKEVENITAILTELLNAIKKELHTPEVDTSKEVQMLLPLFSVAEREQFERNKEALQKRVEQIPHEIEQEVAVIRQRFADPQPRLFPVAITYLIPEKLAR